MKFLTLDGMRGLAALCVVFHHAALYDLLPKEIASSGYLAVDFFFVLSGFVVSHAYGDRYFGKTSALAFFWKRLLRFYPLYLLGLAVGLLKAGTQYAMADADAVAVSDTLLFAAAGLLFLPTWIIGLTGQAFPLNVPSWSLFWELVVNAVYAVLFKHLNLLVLISAMFFAAAGLLYSTFTFGDLAGGWNNRTWWVAIPRVVYSFSAGILIYRYRAAVFNGLGPILPWLSMGLLAAFLLVPLPVQAQRPLFDLLFVLLASPALVIMAASAEPARSFAPVLSFLGAISFPIYAVHMPMLGVVATVARKASSVPAEVFLVTFIVGLSVGSWYINRLEIAVRSMLQGRKPTSIGKGCTSP